MDAGPGSGIAEGVRGRRTLRAAEDGLYSISAAGESRYNWSAVERVGVTAGQAFIFVAALTATPIPTARIERGHFEQFLDFVRGFAPDVQWT